MPKKRFNNLYSKPASTVHPSLNTGTASSSSSNQQNATTTVNTLLNKLRTESNAKRKPVEPVPESRVDHTLPPDIRQFLNQPETPSPRPRHRVRRRYDENGRLIPAGPPPPQSWLRGSVHGPPESRDTQRIYPTDLAALPGLVEEEFDGNRLQDMCLRAMARNWETMQEYEKYNLASLETRLRMLLLSYISVYGPDDGIGYEGLRNLMVFPDFEDQEDYEFDPGVHNKTFFRLDLSGAMGHSISWKQLTELVKTPEEPEATEDSWEDSFQMLQSLSPPLPYLTHLSLSHPNPSISWPKLLAFAEHLPTLTHLSLAYWPVPSSTPNSKLAKFVTSTGREVQYGGTNYYSHLLDNDFIEAAGILRRLASKVYSLEYLDLTGCWGWCGALVRGDEGPDWGVQWPRLETLVLHTGKHLYEESPNLAVVEYSEAFKPTFSLRISMIQTMRRNKMIGKPAFSIDVQVDDLSIYETLWREDRGLNNDKRLVMGSLRDFRRMQIRDKLSEAEFNMEEILGQSRMLPGPSSVWATASWDHDRDG